jgi:putative protease
VNLEILAPAGGPESLRAAVLCGADAVYLGGAGLLNARRSAQGFDEAQLAEAVSFCHGRGAKVYLTLNTLVRESERDLLLYAAGQAAAIGVDAVIIQDVAVARTLRDACPDLPLHGSTQMSVTSAEGVRLLEELGLERVILGRELTLEEIKAVRQQSRIELEIFVHGALCMGLSGQCYLSSLVGARSGNRGLCAQPCRLPFACGNSTHALSLRDLSLLGHLETIAEAGVCAIKIEGRMKRPEYVAAAVTAAVAAREGRPYDAQALAAIFSRSGFTDGYFTGRRDKRMFGIRQKEDVTAATEGLLKSYRALYRQENPRVAVDFALTAQVGRSARLFIEDEDGFTAFADTVQPVEQARSAPTHITRAEAALSKTGGTPFYARSIRCDIGPDVMLPASVLNGLRRDGLGALLTAREALNPWPFSLPAAEQVWQSVPRTAAPAMPAMRMRLGRADQLPIALNSAAEMIILPLHLIDQLEQALPAEALPRLAIELPVAAFGTDPQTAEQLKAARDMGITQAVVESLGALYTAREAGFALHGGARLNIFNTPALSEFERLGLEDATLSFELMLREIGRLGGRLPRGVLAYGHLPLMLLRNCPAKAHQGGCRGINCGYPTLTDRMGKHFFIDCDGRVSTLYNHLPLYMGDRLAELKGVDFYTIYLTRESPAETAEVLAAMEAGLPPPMEHTRGLYYRPENAGGRK